MPVYKLTYFNSRGRGETARLLFAVAGQEFEDIRVDPEKFKEMKPSTPFGMLPVLEVDGKTICQSHTIERYLARQFGLAGKTEWDQARVDMMLGCHEDMISAFIPIFTEKDEEKKKSAMATWEQETQPGFLTRFDKLLPEGHDYFVGNELTVADISFYSLCSMLVKDWTKFPRLKAIIDRVEANPGVAQWLAKRPKTD